jgi:steroid delta-isomerase-like uncharacterized protein
MANLTAIVEQWVEGGWNNGDLALVDQLYAANYTIHDPTVPNFAGGREAFKGYVTTLRTGLPDIHFTVEVLIEQGDKVVWRFVARGTHQGNLLGIPPTGQAGTVHGIVISHFAGGKWTEDWVNWDALGMLQQFGVIPALT